jgi:acyl-CoA dehydrogenase
MITFALTEDQELIREAAHRFAAEEIRPRLRELERAKSAEGLQQKFDALDLTLVDLPEAVGGSGLGTITSVLIHEELAWGDAGAAVALWAPHLVPAALAELASEDQAKRMLTLLGRGRGAVAWSDAGIDRFGMASDYQPGLASRPHATEDGGNRAPPGDREGPFIDGEKRHVINAGIAKAYVVFTRDWAVYVDGERAKAGPRAEWLGLETVQAGSVRFEQAPAERLTGASEYGVACRRFLTRATLMTAARQVGLARAAYETTLAYTQDRVAFGKPVAHFQAVSFTLAEMHMDVESARWLLWQAATAFDQGAPDAVALVAQAGVHANDAAWRVADHAVQLHGGAGFIQDFPVEKWLRDTKTLALIGGCDQDAQLVVAAHLLGGTADLPSPAIQPIVT